MLSRSKRLVGIIGENFAETLLKKKGYKIVEKHFRSKSGEIDLIATQGDTLVFVEVKTRWGKKFGKPGEAVTPRKLAKIKRVGEYFTLINPGLPKKLRIDVVALNIREGSVESAKIIKAI